MRVSFHLRRLALATGTLLVALQVSMAGASEFIEEMPELSQDPDRAGAMIWESPDFRREDYTRVMIEPITIYISPESKEKGLRANELKALADGFVEAVTISLEPEVPVVSQPGPGVLYIRAALVDVKMDNKKRGLMGYTPIGFVVTAAANAAGARIILSDAVLEVEVLDSVSGKRLGVLTDKAPSSADGENLSWDSISQTLTYYAGRFKQRMQIAQ
ncbi:MULTISPECIES: DUF3313 domain-containing protein [Halomonas]|uniref:Uncharacterized protein DUF3313 n=1 Tax=Halomonas ventosae TaxID=229007 RepID=A0A4R6ZLB1_9GAMM|nr:MULTISPECIES: DUF3313 domain-containing protein [Halomonas]TDR53042.1 uncharacterized protein DUF3313 [Halomonas ventosae]WFM72427.1 DUF3313 domain-containing protein [Halomonas sp. CKK8]